MINNNLRILIFFEWIAEDFSFVPRVSWLVSSMRYCMHIKMGRSSSQENLKLRKFRFKLGDSPMVYSIQHENVISCVRLTDNASRPTTALQKSECLSDIQQYSQLKISLLGFIISEKKKISRQIVSHFRPEQSHFIELLKH